MNSPLILIVEDERELAELTAAYLRQQPYRAEIIGDGREVVPAVRRLQPDLILLDIMLPGQDGLTVCREIRQFSQVPIIMVTARVDEIDRLLGLEFGADDYICKPFSPREVVARVRAVLRRTQAIAPQTNANTKRHGLLTIDETAFEARWDNTPLGLTPAEFRLLLAFAQQPARVFSRQQLMDRLYDDHRIVADRTVDSHLKNLRRKLRESGCEQDMIQSVYGVGYRFDPTAEA